ncbi:MAG: transporter substrate-binding domain-containing protein, partial [Niameybacter sp.]
GNAELLATINEVLQEIQEDGTYDALYTQYFGVTE